MSDVSEIVRSLHPLERKALPALAKSGKMSQVVHKLQTSDIEVLRALQWLAAKNAVELNEISFEVLALGENGKLALKDGFAEKKFLKSIEHEKKSKDQMKKDGLTDEEINASIGLLRQKGAMQIAQTDKGLGFTITEAGKKMLHEKTPEELLIQKIENENLQLTDLNASEKNILENLKKRKNIIIVSQKKDFDYKLTDLGLKLQKEDLTEVVISKLTPEMIATGSWKGKEFRPYDVKAPVPKINAGRRHPLKAVMNKMKKIWLEMGFVEMEGPWVESAFWCMDSMWIPQDHPARDTQDTFYLPYNGTLPKDLAPKIAKEHETGGNCGSKGYGYKWDAELAKKLVMRTHTTSATFRKFNEGVSPPAKYFCIGRIFRNETVDATHLAEFHQIEGFVTGEGLTLADLMGYIKEFYNKMGVEKIRFKPTYNPYTEPSMEASAYNEQLGKWVELINSGMFRPESLEPYGIKTPVIAWGLGVERLGMMFYERKLVKEILGPECDIDWLRNYKIPKDE